MYVLRRFALVAVVFDIVLSAGILMASGERAEASEAAAPVIRYIPTVDGCGMLRARGKGVWRYEGLVDASACAASQAARR